MFRRKRRYSILVLLGIVAAIFLCFQLFSIKVLNLHSQSERSLQPPADKQVKISIIKDSDPNAQNAIDPVKNCLSENCEGKEDEKVYIRSNNKVVRKEQMEYMVKEAILNKGVQDLRKKNEESLWEFLERQYSRGDYPQRGEKNVTRGVYYKWAPLYEPQDKIFTCIISKVSSLESSSCQVHYATLYLWKEWMYGYVYVLYFRKKSLHPKSMMIIVTVRITQMNQEHLHVPTQGMSECWNMHVWLSH